MEMMWTPTLEISNKTNIAKALGKLGLIDYQALHSWSVQNYQDFWRYTLEQLKIQFAKRPDAICDTRLSPNNPSWFPGASLNIVNSCFQAPSEKLAVIAQSENGQQQTMTYGELNRLSNQVANGLIQRGFLPGDRVAILLPMTALAVAIYLGIIKAGCVAVGIAESFAVEEIATRLELAKVKAVFSMLSFQRANKKIALYEKIIAAGAGRVILIGAEDTSLRSCDSHWHDFIAGTATNFNTINCESSAHTTILFSSGTTGEPKAIPWTHTTPIKCASDAYFHHDLKAEDVLAWPTSLGWMMGPWLIYAGLINQATLALYDGLPTERAFGEFVQQAKVSVLGVVPSLVKIWRSTECMQGLDWQAIKCFSSTGECSNPDDMSYLMALAGNKPVIEYCGGTEIGGAYITGTLVQPAIAAQFSAKALGIDFVLFDEQGKFASRGEVGILGPSLGLSSELLNSNHESCYFAGMPTLADGRILRRHGDELECLANGYYRALGRVDDTMNLGGIKISSVQIERVLNNLPGIRDSAAIAIQPPQGGPERLVIYACIQAEQSRDTSYWLSLMQQAIREHLNPLFKIETVVIVESLPRTASNKLMRRVLKKQHKLS